MTTLDRWGGSWGSSWGPIAVTPPAPGFTPAQGSQGGSSGQEYIGRRRKPGQFGTDHYEYDGPQGGPADRTPPEDAQDAISEPAGSIGAVGQEILREKPERFSAAEERLARLERILPARLERLNEVEIARRIALEAIAEEEDLLALALILAVVA